MFDTTFFCSRMYTEDSSLSASPTRGTRWARVTEMHGVATMYFPAASMSASTCSRDKYSLGVHHREVCLECRGTLHDEPYALREALYRSWERELCRDGLDHLVALTRRVYDDIDRERTDSTTTA